MDLIDDEDGVLANLRGDADLVEDGFDILDGVIRRRIELVDIERPLLIECPAGLALITSVVSVLGVETVDGLGEDTRTGGLTDASWSAEEVGMRQPVETDSVLQGLRQSLLSDHRLEGLRTVLTRGNNVIRHKL